MVIRFILSRLMSLCINYGVRPCVYGLACMGARLFLDCLICRIPRARGFHYFPLPGVEESDRWIIFVCSAAGIETMPRAVAEIRTFHQTTQTPVRVHTLPYVYELKYSKWQNFV